VEETEVMEGEKNEVEKEVDKEVEEKEAM